MRRRVPKTKFYEMMKTKEQHITPLTRLASAAVLLLFAGAFLTRCASIGNPTGGPRDSLAPTVVSVTPMLNATNFTGDRIYLGFDEYVQLKDQQKELYTSPAMKKKPTVAVRGRGIQIDLVPDSLEPNTTYAIEFGASVADNNEGNPLHGLRYVFSTGPIIDSLYMSGYTEDSQTADSLGRTYICFFEADSVPEPKEYDSTMFNFKPSKIARSQRNGIFIAQNLKPVPYRVYAYWDKNENQSYEPSIDKVGFLEDTYNPAQMPSFAIWYDSVRRYPSADPQIYLRMFTDVSFRRQTLREKLRPDQHKIILSFGGARPQISKLELEGIPADSIIYEYLSDERDSMALWLNLRSELLPDTIKGSITYLKHDSVRVLHPETEELRLSWRRVESREQERERERLERQRARAEAEGKEWREPPRASTFRLVKPTTNTEINPEQDLEFEFDTPLTRFDSTAFVLRSWSEKRDTVRESITFRPDSLSPRKWRMHSRWLADRSYQLFIPTDVLADITGEGNDSLRLNFKVADIAKFATLQLEVKPRTEGAKYIIQLLDERNSVQREFPNIGAGVQTINYVPTGDMRIRIIEDLNGNGRWDSGNLVERRQSERAELYRNEQQEELFTMKAGWEFEFSLDMATLFAPVTMEQLIEQLDRREQVRLQKEAEKRRQEAASGDGHNHNSTGRSTSTGMGGSMGGMMGGGSMGGAARLTERSASSLGGR